MSILQETQNLLKLYLHVCGEDEVPPAYHVWACLTTVAACVGDRVYFHRVKEMPLYPNLYTFLIGESGSGKGRAIRFAKNFIEEIPLVNYYEGKITAPRLLDKLGRPTFNEVTGVREVANSKMYLSSPELAMSLGKGDLAQSFIEQMTELYGGNTTLQEGTRTHGDVVLKNVCINWIAGSTKEWLLKAVSPEAIQSGFFARTVAVYGDDNCPRMFRPRYPSDYEEVMDHIQTRIRLLCCMRGEMLLTQDAEKFINEWYLNRDKPEDDLLKPVWNRQREMVLKLAMVLRLTDGGTELVIDFYHLQAAVKLSRIVGETMPDLVEFASRTPETKTESAVARLMQSLGTVDHTTLLKKVYRYGIAGRQLHMAMMDMKNKGQVLYERSEKGGVLYTWVG